MQNPNCATASRPCPQAFVSLALSAVLAWAFAITAIAAPSTGTTKTTGTNAPALDFPRMPSGREQLALANEHPFIIGENFSSVVESPERRAAYEKTIKYFPNDKTTVLLATIEIARLDKYAGRGKQALKRLLPLIASSQNDVPSEVLVEAEFMHADLLESLDRDAEAGEVLTRIALDTRLPADKRVEAALSAVGHLRLEKMLSLFDEMLKLDTDTKQQAQIYYVIGYWCFQNNDDNAVRARIKTLLNTKPGKAHAILAEVVDDSGNWQNGAWQARFGAMIEELVPAPSEKLANALAWRKTTFAAQDKLQSLLAENPDAELRKLAKPNPSLQNLHACKLAIEEAKQKQNAALCVQLHLQSLAVFPIQGDYREFSWRLRAALRDLDWKDRQDDTRAEDPLYLQILELCELFPRNNFIHIEGQFWRASYLARRGKRAEAMVLCEKLNASPDTPTDIRANIATLTQSSAGQPSKRD